MPINHRRGRPDMTRDTKQHRGNEVGRRDDRRHAEQQRKRGMGIKMIRERNQKRQTHDPAKAGQYSDRESNDDARDENEQPRWFEQQAKRVPRYLHHVRRHRASFVVRPKQMLQHLFGKSPKYFSGLYSIVLTRSSLIAIGFPRREILARNTISVDREFCLDPSWLRYPDAFGRCSARRPMRAARARHLRSALNFWATSGGVA